MYKPSKATIKRWHCSSNEKNKLKQQSAVNIQNTEDDLKILLRILSINTFTITSLIHLRDYTSYAWTQVDTISVRTPEERQTFRRSYCSTGRARFNPHLPCGVAFCHQYQYRLPSTSIHIYKVITLRRIFRRLVASRGGLVVGFEEATGNWSQIDSRALE